MRRWPQGFSSLPQYRESRLPHLLNSDQRKLFPEERAGTIHERADRDLPLQNPADIVSLALADHYLQSITEGNEPALAT